MSNNQKKIYKSIEILMDFSIKTLNKNKAKKNKSLKLNNKAKYY